MVELKKYEEQYERVKRWYELFKEINNKKDHTRNTNYEDDVVFAFFQNCYHLKDWIKNDDDIIMKKDIEDYVNANECLKICSDICNGSKHSKLTRPRTGYNTGIGPKKFNLEIGPEGVNISINYLILVNDKAFDAFKLASESMEKWKYFIEKEIE